MNKKPARQPAITQSTSDVIGYFNANSWPVNISISSLGRSFNLSPGGYVVDEAGRKVNDPIFENYVGPMQLSREWSPAPITILRVVPTAVVTPSAGTSPVHEASSFVRDSAGNTRPVLKTPAASQVSKASSSPVTGMTMDEARRLRFVRPTIEPNDDAPEDTAGTPADLSGVRPIEYARDASPKDLRRRTPANMAVTSVPDEHVPDNHELVDVTKILAAAARNVSEVSAPPVVASVPPVVAVSEPVLPPETPQSRTPLTTLPQPDLDGPETQSSNPRAMSESDEKRFVCSVDGKGFDFRSQLARWAKRKFPERFEEIMRPYPLR